MSEHAWVQEQIAAYLASGLDAVETERFETHVGECPTCHAVLGSARTIDRRLTTLFASAAPSFTFEDRLIQTLRTDGKSVTPAPRSATHPRTAQWRRRVAWGVATACGIGALGIGGKLLMDGSIPFPGISGAEKEVAFRQASSDDASSDAITRMSRRSLGYWNDSFGDGNSDLAYFHIAGDESLVGRGAGSDFRTEKRTKTQEDLIRPQDRTYTETLKESGSSEYPTVRNKADLRTAAPSNESKPIAEVPTSQDRPGDGEKKTNSNYELEKSLEQSLKGLKDMAGKLTTSSVVPTTSPPPFPVLTLPSPQSPTSGRATSGPVPANPPIPGISAGGDSGKIPLGTKPTDGRGENTKNGFSGGGSYFRPGQEIQAEESYKASEKSREKSEPTSATERKPGTEEGESRSENKVKGGGKESAPTGQPKSPAPTSSGASGGSESAPAAAPVETARKIIIRSGDIEFEIDSFDSAVATVTKLVHPIKGAFVGTVNSEKLPNGKVKGVVTVRIPPEFLDGFVLDLRKDLGKTGELKGQRISSQDVTKMYTDMESRLKAARTMETRLLEIIKSGKGEIKQLLEAERELGIWRTKIEELEGELRYYGNLASLSTLTITLVEKEIRTASGITESERVQAGVECEDVDKVFQQASAAVLEAKGRITKSELKQLAAGQLSAVLHFEVSPDQSGPFRDRLRQLGRMARLEVDRVQTADGPTVTKEARVKRGDTVFQVQFYNLANIAPRETNTIQVAVPNVAQAYGTIREAIEKAKGRVHVAQIQEGDQQNISAQIDFDVKRVDEGMLQNAINGAGDLVSRNVSRAAESDSVTDTKVLVRLNIIHASRLTPRETTVMQVAVPEVGGSYRKMYEAIEKAKARVVSAQLNETDRQNVTGQFDVEVRRADEAALLQAFTSGGEVVARNTTRAAEGTYGTDNKVMLRVSLYSDTRLRPRESNTLQIAVADVAVGYRKLQETLAKSKGRVIDARMTEGDPRQMVAQLDFEIPRADEAAVAAALTGSGDVLKRDLARLAPNEQGSDLKIGFRVSLFNEARLPARDSSNLQVAVPDVSSGFRTFHEAVTQAKGHIVTAQLNEGDRRNVTAQLDFEIPRSEEKALSALLNSTGDVLSRDLVRLAPTEQGSDKKIMMRMLLVSATKLRPRETTTLGIEAGDVDNIATVITSQVVEAKGRVVDSQITHERSGRTIAQLVYDVPLASATGVIERVKGTGTVRVNQSVRDPQAPEGKFAVVRLSVTLQSSDTIVAKDEGAMHQMRKGLSYSATSLLSSLTWVIYALCVILPWTLLIYGCYRMARRLFRKDQAAPTASDTSASVASGAPAPTATA